MTTATQKLAAQIAGLAAKEHQRSPQLAFQTIEEGAIAVTDELDTLKGAVGIQFDGSTTTAEFIGPAPLTPSPPLLSSSPGSLVVGWDGLWTDGDVVPMNFTRVEVHVSATPAFDSTTAATLKGTFETPRGGEISLAMTPGSAYVQLVARNLSGARGPASEEMTVVVTPAGVQDAAGETVAGFSSGGFVSAVGASIEATEFDADGEATAGLTIYGKEFLAHLGERTTGINAQVYRTGLTISKIQSEYGIYEVSWMALPGRHYRVTFQGGRLSTTAATAGAVLRIRRTTDGSKPTNASSLGREYTLPLTTQGAMGIPPITWGGTFVSATGVPTLQRLLFTLDSWNNSSTDYMNLITGATFPLECFVDDMGIDVPDTFLANTGGGSLYVAGTTTEVEPPTPAPKRNYVKTVASNGWATYRSTNTRLRGSANGVGDTSSYVFQGYSSAGSFNGDQRGLWTFPSMTADLAGATLTKLEFYIYFQHWYNNVGGTALIRFHNYADNGWPTGATTVPALTGLVTKAGWPKPGGQWVAVPATYLDEFKAGTLKGVAIGPAASTSTTYYGYARAAAQMRYSYTK